MEDFHSQWIAEEEHILNDLLFVPPDRPDLHMRLISRVLSHYAEYNSRLFRLADRYIFLALSGYWLTPIERSLFWQGGLKPTILFCFTPPDLNEAQRREIEMLRQHTVQRETEIEAIMREVESTMTALVTMTALHGDPKNGEARGYAETRVMDIANAVFREADRLRKHVLSRKLEVLNTTQAVQFLAFVANNQILTHRFSLHQAMPV